MADDFSDTIQKVPSNLIANVDIGREQAKRRTVIRRLQRSDPSAEILVSQFTLKVIKALLPNNGFHSAKAPPRALGSSS